MTLKIDYFVHGTTAYSERNYDSLYDNVENLGLFYRKKVVGDKAKAERVYKRS
ncbi:MAG: hypothetical protein LBL34_02790 [Clostridiales bacterium]|jgi:hypothetical protein|nr:hypothetical protein [Clostridiales bacterium]